jgi:hypothetical protein
MKLWWGAGPLHLPAGLSFQEPMVQEVAPRKERGEGRRGHPLLGPPWALPSPCPALISLDSLLTLSLAGGPQLTNRPLVESQQEETRGRPYRWAVPSGSLSRDGRKVTCFLLAACFFPLRCSGLKRGKKRPTEGERRGHPLLSRSISGSLLPTNRHRSNGGRELG